MPSEHTLDALRGPTCFVNALGHTVEEIDSADRQLWWTEPYHPAWETTNHLSDSDYRLIDDTVRAWDGDDCEIVFEVYDDE